MRSISAVAWSVSSLPRLTARSTDDAICERECSSGASPGSWTWTLRPARAADSAMPEPMNPAPTTPSCEMAAVMPPI